MQIAELCHEIEDRDDALAKAREAAHKAQLQKYQASLSLFISFSNSSTKAFIFSSKFPLINALLRLSKCFAYALQGVEEHQTVLLEKQSELAQLQGEHNAKVLEAQKLQRALDRKQQELGDLQRAKEQLDEEVEDLQQQKKNGDKALNVRPPDFPIFLKNFIHYLLVFEEFLSETVYDIITSRI